MSYRRQLWFEFSRRDHLTVLTVAVAVAFFTSTVMVAGAVAGQTTAIAADFGTPGVVSAVDAESEGVEDQSVEDGVYLPAVTVDGGRVDGGSADGDRRILVGASNASAAWVRDTVGVPLPGPPPRGVSVERPGETTSVIVPSGSTTRSVRVVARDGGRTVVPGDWYVGGSDLVRGVDSTDGVRASESTGGYVIRNASTVAANDGTPLQGGLAFFAAATRGVRALLTVTSLGVGILTAGIVFSVTRMTVRDHRRTIKVIRVTGGSRRRVLVDFAVRAGILVAVGLALGYAFGVIGTNAAVNVAVFAGLPTSLTTRVTAEIAATLLPGYVVVLALGVVAGALAALPSVLANPAHVDADRDRESADGRFSPTVLSWRVLWPAASALTVFVTVVLVVAAVGGALGPLVAGGGQTLSEPGAVHPVASNVPTAYAGVFEGSGVEASPEVLAFTVLDGRATLVRGAEYDRFAAVSDATIEAGRTPSARHEAVVGADLAATLDLGVGDTVTLGGSTTPAFTSVDVVGRYDAPGYHDDQLVVSLPTSRHLTGKADDSVHFVRLDDRVDGDDSVRVIDVTVPERVAVGDPVRVTASVLNPTNEPQSVSLPARFGDATTRIEADVPASETSTLDWTVTPNATGEQPVEVGDVTRTVSVVPPNAVTVEGLPDRVPPNATLTVVVRTLSGSPANATVAFDDQTRKTGADGRTTVTFATTGTRTLVVEHDGYETTTTVEVAANATRSLTYDWNAPASVTPLARPTPALVATNPWNQSVTETVSIGGPGVQTTRTVTVPAGGRDRYVARPGRIAPGSYAFTATVDGRTVVSHALAVRGDDRLAAALASRAGTGAGSTGIGRAIATVFGNVQLVLAVVLGFAALMSVAGTAAAFAYDVHAKHHELGVYRTVGASRTQVLRVLVGDAVRIGTVTTAVAVAASGLAVAALDHSGLLRLFGVDVAPGLAPGLLAITAGTALALALAGTVVAAVPVLRANPISLLERGDR
ncbi:FtsX-like permease family protein [Halorubellus litoreus]|uniref:FtsX-like permease family protein n=1 Tax=Halorubellus litoreus TaxID=755308 RepID=A0ABD5VKN2_9EURY